MRLPHIPDLKPANRKSFDLLIYDQSKPDKITATHLAPTDLLLIQQKEFNDWSHSRCLTGKKSPPDSG